MKHIRQNWKTYAFWILLSEAVGGLSGWLTREGTQIYQSTVAQPPLSPPPLVFPIVWGILFSLMGIGAARVYLAPPSGRRTRALAAFLLQLLFNFFWSIIFFNMQAYLFAFVWIILLWASVLATIIQYRKISTLAAALQVPYLLWITFAAYLNLAIFVLNR